MTTKVKLIADGAITPDQITLTTASAGTNTTAPATTAFVQQEITALVDSSPAALNTLNELAAALGDDANFSTTVTNSIATKAPLASPDFTGDVEINNTGNADSTLLKLKNTPSTAGTYKTGLEFWSNEGTANNQTFNAGRIYSEFDGNNYANTRLTLGSASGGGTFNDELNITNGKVGIGTSSPVAPLTINDKATISFNVNDFALGHQLYYDSVSDRWERLTGYAGSALYQTAGTIVFYRTTAGGATGDAVTPSESMRIDSAGNVGIGTTSPGVSLDIGSKTDAIKVPSGTTAQRPSSPAAGMIRYNTTNSNLELYNSMWLPVKTDAPIAFQQASTYHRKWTIAADGQSAQAGSGYSAISVNINFEGDFKLITKWSHDYMGVGIGYKNGITNGNFTGESADAAGPYGGGANVDGFDSTVSYMGQYHWPVNGGGANTNSTTYYIKHQRVGNIISTHYSTNSASATDPGHSSWTQVQSATISSTDHCKPLWGEASSNESVALTLLYNDITGGFNAT